MVESSEVAAATMIVKVGTARSCYVEAMRAARAGNPDEAAALIETGREFYTDGHQVHADLLTSMARGEDVKVDLLLAHAEDQLMAADQLRHVAEEFLGVYERLNRLEAASHAWAQNNTVTDAPEQRSDATSLAAEASGNGPARA